MPSIASELAPVSISASDINVRIFRLNLHNVTVELSSLGATITKILLPNYKHPNQNRDDIVLSYASPEEQYRDNNSVYFGAIVGRVANRIKNGQFQLHQTEMAADGSSEERLETYQLDINNSPNHLHGGFDGFSSRNWDADIVNNAVQFTLHSPDGDQGYPGGIEVMATYSLTSGSTNNGGRGVQLHLAMTAKLEPGETKATPISLAQHSYFNLASHSSPERILDHVLKMPNCDTFTPVDSTSIPTGAIYHVEDSAMDFRAGVVMSNALMRYGEENGMKKHELMSYDAPIFGFDHNYVLSRTKTDESDLRVAGVLMHPPTGRLLCVSTNAPGVQLYTSNYLNRMNPGLCKDQFSYNRWQGICLETQTYPDCIGNAPYDSTNVNFRRGGCFILKPGGDTYAHHVLYELSGMSNVME